MHFDPVTLRAFRQIARKLRPISIILRKSLPVDLRAP